MRLQNIFRLQKLYYLFFIRQVLSVGILKEKQFRLLAIFLLLAWLTITIFANYDLFEGSLVLPEVNLESVLIRSRVMEVVTWTIGAFILIKLLFLKKGAFLQMTIPLPITNRERNTSLLLFELLMILFIVTLLSVSYAIAFAFRFGLFAIVLLVSVSAFTCLTLYLLLQLGYVLVSYGLDVVNLVKLKTIFVYLILAVKFVFIQQSITTYMLRSGFEGFHWSLFFIWLNDEVHFIAPFLIFLSMGSILLLLILYVPNQAYIEEKSYANIKLLFLKKTKLINIYLLQLIRRIENYITVILSGALFIFLKRYVMTAGIINPFNAVMLVALLGLYTYTQTDKIRMIAYKLNYRCWYDYFALIFSQMLFISFLSILFFIVDLFISNTRFVVTSYLNIYFNTFITVLVTTYAGVLFPTKKENPFSPFMGTILTMILMAALFYFSAVLSFSVIADTLIRFVFCIFIISVSWIGLVKLKEEARYEKHKSHL